MVDKNKAKELYRSIIQDLDSCLNHADSVVREEFMLRVQRLRGIGAWYHYAIVKRKIKDYRKRDAAIGMHNDKRKCRGLPDILINNYRK
jgi:hypothetical protein